MSVRQIALLTNPVAGRGRGPRIRELVLPRLRSAGFEVRDLLAGDADEASALAQAAVADGLESLVVIGGDGTVHLGVQAVARSATALGIIPAGFGNDAARHLGLPRDDPAAATDRIIASRRRRIDLARSGASWFVTVLAAGLDALVHQRVHRSGWPGGQAGYVLAALAELPGFEARSYLLELDGRPHRTRAMLVAVGNGPSYGGGLRITEGAELDDGLLDVVVIKEMSRAELVATYPRLLTGGHTRHPSYERHRVRSVTVAGAGIEAYADGEWLGSLPLSVECVPEALEVIS